MTVGGAIVDHGVTRDGVVQLRRWWPAERAWGAMLVVHGIGEHSGRYAHVARLCNARGLDVVAIDLRGFGGSGGRRGDVDDFDDHLDDVADQLAELDALHGPTVLLGHSMGGLIALCTVLSGRAAPDALVLSAPALAATVPAPLRAAARVLPRVVPSLRVPTPIDPASLASDPAVGAAYLADPLVVRHTTARLGGALLARMGWAGDHLDRLRCPTLVVHGGDDAVVPTASSEPLGACPGVTRRVYPGLRHEVLNEPSHPAIVDDIVGWIADVVGVVDPRLVG